MNVIEKPAEYLFQQFCENYKKRNLASVLALFSKNAHVWGTGLNEYRKGLHEIENQIKKEWVESEKGEIDIVFLVPTPSHANWLGAICQAKVIIGSKEYVFDDLRYSIVAEQENNEWKIVYMHASFPDYRNTQNGAFPVES